MVESESKWPKEISMSNEKKGPRFCCLGYIETILLHSYMGIIVKHYKDSY